MTRRALLTVLGILLLAVASTWLSHEGQQPTPPLAEGQAHTPSYFMKAFTAVTMDEQGRPQHRLEADALTHYADDDTTELVKPRLQVLLADNSSWLIQAERGTASTTTEELQLYDNVVLQRPDPRTNAGVRIATESLQVQPNRKFAQSSAPVTITEPSGHVEAVGMRAYFADERLELLSAVRGVYETN